MKALHAAHTALRWLVDHLARPVVIGTLIVLCWAVLGACWALWRSAPIMAGLVASHGGMLFAGVCWRDRRLKALAVVSEWHDEEIGAIKLADTIADKELLTPDPAPIVTTGDLLMLNAERSWRLRDREVELYDQDAEPAHEMKVLGEEDAMWCGCGRVMAFTGRWVCPDPACPGLPDGASTYERRLS